MCSAGKKRKKAKGNAAFAYNLLMNPQWNIEPCIDTERINFSDYPELEETFQCDVMSKFSEELPVRRQDPVEDYEHVSKLSY